jgi:hypothetical protein
VAFVGLRSDRYAETVRLFRDIIGIPVTRQATDMTGFRLGDGTVLEIYGPADDFHSFFTTGPVVGFRVGDFDATRTAMLAAQVEFIGAIQHADGVSWQHFRCPDGTVAEIIGPGQAPVQAVERLDTGSRSYGYGGMGREPLADRSPWAGLRAAGRAVEVAEGG